MAKFRRSPKFGRNHSRLGSLDGVQFTHPLAEITQRTRWGPRKFQVTLKPFRGSRTNHYKSSLPTLGSFMYPQGVQNGPFGLKQTLTGRKALYSEKSTLHGYATAWTEAYSVAKMVSWHNPVNSSSMKRLSTKLSISVAITTWEIVMSEMPKKREALLKEITLGSFLLMILSISTIVGLERSQRWL